MANEREAPSGPLRETTAASPRSTAEQSTNNEDAVLGRLSDLKRNSVLRQVSLSATVPISPQEFSAVYDKIQRYF
ncbi:hypothetical protein ACJZ2D_007933 [Fusarium nematophilum]